jgi:hypothetical protein
MDASAYCGRCRTRLEWPDDIADSDEVVCPSCGESAGTFGSLRHDAEQAVLDKINGVIEGRGLK